LQRALRAAEASGHLVIAARAELSLAFVHGHMLRRHAQGRFWVDLAGATLERLGDAPRKTVIERLLLEGDLLADEGRANEAAPVFERALALQEAAFGPDHPSVATTLARLATTSATLERFPEAFAFARRSLEASERLLGPEHPALSIPLHSMGFLFYSSGRIAEGRPFLERALAIETRAFGADHPELVKTLIALSNLHDDHASAIALLERAWAIQERTAGPSHPDSLLILKNLAVSYGLIGRHQAQLAHAERALPIEEGLLGPEHPEVAVTLLMIGQAHAGLGRPARGLPYLERAFSVAEARPLTDSLAAGRVTRMDARRQLADALWQVGRERDRARTLALDGLSLAQGDGDEMAAARASLEAWLAGHQRP
jgi:eukaryotic-like serine/threonine-protein kinase